MQEFGKGFDGTLKKATKAAPQLDKMPSFVQSYMLTSNFTAENTKKSA